MNVLIIVLLFFLAAVFHQSLYILIPLVAIYQLSIGRDSRLQLSPLIMLYMNVVLVVAMFVFAQTLFYGQLETFSIKGLARYISYFSFAVIAYGLQLKDISTFFKIAILFFVFTLPWGVYQVLSVERYQNIFNHANHFAYVLCICIYFLVVYKPFGKNLRTISLLVLFTSLVLTKSSGAMLVLLTILGYNLFVTKRISLNKKLIFVAVFLTATLFVLFTSEKIAAQLDSLDYLKWDFLKVRVEQFKTGGHGSFIWRVIYWIKILFSFFEETWLKIFLGVGVDTMTEGNMPYPYMYKDPHNDFLKILVEFGVLGVVFFIAYFFKLYKITNKNFRIIILMLIPIFFGNAIVNFPFNLSLILLIAYGIRQNHIKSI